MSGNHFSRITVLFAISLFCSLPAFAEVSVVDEAEPNNPCIDAQIIDGVPLPFSIAGSLDSTATEPDVDFFRVSGAAGEYVEITLEGASTGAGTLGDPYLGYFDADCQLVAASDDDGGTLNSRLLVPLPESGEYVLGATHCCDSEFLGGGIGTYLLNVSEAALIGQIAGRVVDADSLEPLPGDSPPYAVVSLYRSSEWGAYQWLNNQATGPDGTFAFTSDFLGMPLTAGQYAIALWAEWYSDAWIGPFEVAEGEMLDLGDLPLDPIELIGFVSGRLVDALDASPLPGYSPPYASVHLERCEDWGCYVVAWGVPTNEQGVFVIDGRNYWVGPGVFRILAFAEDYYPLATETFELGDKESADLGDLQLMPLPIAFGEVSGCDVLPMGKTCSFTVRVHNRGPGRYRGEAWSIVQYFSQTFPNRTNWFQIGRSGARNPNPVRISLAENGWTTLQFRLEIPGIMPEGTQVCVSANVGRDPYPQFNAYGDRMLFCAMTQFDGSLSRLSKKESRRLLSEMRSRRE